eukprot:10696557-Heterocapsa_arctica.AAC.1
MTAYPRRQAERQLRTRRLRKLNCLARLSSPSPTPRAKIYSFAMARLRRGAACPAQFLEKRRR